jgi:hypothetical protein
MGSQNVEQLWYALWLIRAILSGFLLGAVTLLCTWVLRRIPWKSRKRNPVKHSVVHSLGTLRPPRNFAASESDIDLCRARTKRHNGREM